MNGLHLLFGVTLLIAAAIIWGLLKHVAMLSRELDSADAQVRRLVVQRDLALDENQSIRLTHPVDPAFAAGPGDLPASELAATIAALEAYANKPGDETR